MDTKMSPLLLLDEPDGGYCEDYGMVETTVTEDEARDALAEFCFDEDGQPGGRPEFGPAEKVWQSPDDEYAERWSPCEPTDDGAIEFWRVPTA